MRTAGSQPQHRVLPAEGGCSAACRASGNDGGCCVGQAVLRLPQDSQGIGETGRGPDGEADEDLDAPDGVAGDHTEEEHQQEASRAPGVSVPARRDADPVSEPGVGDGHHLHQATADRLCVFGGDHRPVQPEGPHLAVVDQHGFLVLRGSVAGSPGPLRGPVDLQHRPGEPVHQCSLRRHIGEPPRAGEHGRQGSLARQHLRRAAVEDGEVRGHPPQRVSGCPVIEEGFGSIFPVLQRGSVSPGTGLRDAQPAVRIVPEPRGSGLRVPPKLQVVFGLDFWAHYNLQSCSIT